MQVLDVGRESAQSAEALTPIPGRASNIEHGRSIQEPEVRSQKGESGEWVF